MYVRNPELDGLGFPVFTLIMLGTAVAGLFRHPKKPKVTKEQAKTAVQQIYLELLERDPWNPYDAGAEGYVNCLVEGWCNTDFVRTEVLKAPEYRDVQMRKAAKAYGPAESGAVTTSGLPLVPGAPSFQSLTSMTVAGIPVVYIVGGIVLLSLLKRR